MSPPASPGGPRWTESIWRPAAFLALPVAVSAWRFAAITRNYFFGDDLFNFYQIATLGVLDQLVAPYAGHSLATRNLILQCLARVVGTNPAPYFWLAFLTHLANVCLLFAVIRGFTRSDALACLGALLWGASPIDEHALGWFSVYGQVLGVTALLWILLDLGRIAAGAPPTRFVAARWVLLLGAASTSFGTGIGFALVLPIAAAILLPPAGARWRVVACLGAGALFVIALYVGLPQLPALLRGGYRPKPSPFLTASPPAWPLAQLTLGLFAFGAQSLLLNGFAPHFDYPGVVTIGAAIAAAALLAAAFAAGPATARRTLLASLLLSAGCYGTIAAGRILFAIGSGQTVAAMTGRYHYAGPVPLAIAVCVAVGALARGRARSAVAVGAIAFALVSQASLRRPIDNHDIYRVNTMRTLYAMRQRIRAAPPGDVYIENGPFHGIGPLVGRNPMFPGLAGAFAIFFPDNTFEGHRVFFVEPRWRVIRAAQGRRRIGELLVPERGQSAIRLQ